MAAGAEGRYRVRKVTCSACAEKAKTELDMQEGTAEPGIQLHVERIRERGDQ